MLSSKKLEWKNTCEKDQNLFVSFVELNHIINGNLRIIDKTNLTYLEPHRIIINDITFLAFNYSNEIFIENLNNKIKLSELENYLKHN